MENKIFYVSIKCGEFDFGVSAKIEQLNQEQYNELKSMLVTAIGAMESMRHNSINETNYEIKEDQMKEELKKEIIKDTSKKIERVDYSHMKTGILVSEAYDELADKINEIIELKKKEKINNVKD